MNNRAPFGTSGLVLNLGPREWKTFASVSDGLSNTLFMAERSIAESRYHISSIIEGFGIGVIQNPRVCMNLKENAKNLSKTEVDSISPNSVVWEFSGRRIGCCLVVYNRFYTILPPNSPSCVQDSVGYGPGPVSATSYHTGGINTSMGDGSVSFISDTIDAGPLTDRYTQGDGPSPNDAKRTGQSTFGLWGSLGSINGGESVSLP